ncbi:alanine racemase [Keratinibaculum paraultunense]|uniref:Alanine racemase n=1 Tax=Keratinibaculum paraultunense TaxID=1278232 RepID=A0A4R3KZ98_9FIRM|nr:alanine racemase [Keratinibaculum paraultunense]QQY80025.1 alanine racemase [Keratinibaculum paraultunense]TCS91654.1 alanine racemase [Keratinibaculum paraultunense]
MQKLNEIRPVWAEINLDNLIHNIKEVRRITKKDTLVTAVVKANAYGHGSVEVAKAFLENGADRLAVATLSEAIELRKADILAPILILGYTPIYQYRLVTKWGIEQTIYNYESAKALSDVGTKLGKNSKIHIKIDTGMGRIGFLPNKNSIEEIIKISKLPNLKIEGIYTHFAKADEKNKEYTTSQFKKFMYVVNELEKNGINIPTKHVSNSAAIIDLPQYNLDMVRAGIMLYGYYPSDEVDKDKVILKPAMTLKAKVSNVKMVPKGTHISYGGIYTTDKESQIATIPIGYADGFSRLLTSKAEAFIRGKRVPVVGKICMDQCMLDVSEVENINIEDEVVLFGYEKDYPTVEEIANKLGTISYEIICMVGRRIPRVYIKNGEIVKIIDYLLD